MKTLCPREVDIPTYYFGVHKIVGISSYKVMFGYTVAKGIVEAYFYIVLLLEALLMVYSVTQMEII